jgi:hypothetical protein
MTKMFTLPPRQSVGQPPDEELLRLVRLLRYGSALPDQGLPPVLNLKSIATVIGLSRYRVKNLLAEPLRTSITPEGERGKRRGKLTV